MDDSLKGDILENKDQDIQKKIQKQIEEIRDKYNNLRKKIKKLNKKQKDKIIKNRYFKFLYWKKWKIKRRIYKR